MSPQSPVNPFHHALANLSELRQVCWQELRRGAENPEHPWSLCVFGTVDGHSPALRTLVLREVEHSEYLLTFQTDVRSPKFRQLKSNPASSILFWDPIKRVQLLLTGTTQAIESGPLVAEQWAQTELTQRRAYLGDRAPGDEAETMYLNFPEEFAFRPPTEEESKLGLENFGVLRTEIQSMDLLVLRPTGNVRAHYVRNGNSTIWTGSWTAP